MRMCPHVFREKAVRDRLRLRILELVNAHVAKDFLIPPRSNKAAAVTLDGHDDDAEESEVKFGQSCNWRDYVK